MTEFDLVLRGKLVREQGVVAGEIGINDGRIAAISEGTSHYRGGRELDFGDLLVFPGMIDVHVHCLSNPDEGFIETGRSAAAGGITTMADMPFDAENPITDAERFRQKVRKVERDALVDMCLWATIAKTGGTDQIKPLAAAGAMAFKLSTFESNPYRFPRIPDDEVLKAFDEIRETGLIAAFHAENDEVISGMIREYRAAGRTGPRAHHETRPPLTETADVLKLLEFAYWKKVKLHIVHVSHPRTMDWIVHFRRQGVQASGETCFQYLLLDEGAMDAHGYNAKVNPPLRSPEAVEGMWDHLLSGNISFITSDHAVWKREEKESGKEDIFRAASGMPGLELMVPLMFSAAVSTGKISPVRFAGLMARQPAEMFGLAGKGRIAVGYDADFTVIDPEREWTVDEAALLTSYKSSPFHGVKVKGKVTHTIVRGTVVHDNGRICAEPGFGRFVPGKAYGFPSGSAR